MSETMRQPTGGKVPVTECFAQAWRFLEQNWRLLLPAAAITAAIATAGMALAMVLRPADMATQSMLAVTVWNLISTAPAMIATTMFAAAVLRKAVRNEFVGRTGLAFGADEIRLLGVMAALLCMLLPLGGLFFLVLFTFVFSRFAATQEELNVLLADPDALSLALENALGPTGMLAFSLLILAALALVIYFSTRLTMINAATIGERRIVIFQTWSWSRGNVWRVLGAILITALPIVFFQGLLESLSVELLNMAPEGAAGMMTMLAVTAVNGFLVAVSGIPTIALGAILYRGLRPADFVAK